MGFTDTDHKKAKKQGRISHPLFKGSHVVACWKGVDQLTLDYHYLKNPYVGDHWEGVD